MSETTSKDMVSVRMPADLLAAMRRLADDRGESLSDVLRRASLLVLGICPTCERPTGPEEGTTP